MIGQAHRVGRTERRGGRGIQEEAHHLPHGFVREQDIPVSIEHHRGKRLLLTQHESERLLHLGHLGRVQPRLAIDRRIAGRGEQVVATAQGYLEHSGQEQNHLAARLRAAGLEKAQVPRRDLRLERQAELAHPPPLAPLLEEAADGTRPSLAEMSSRALTVAHARQYTRAAAGGQLPRR